MVAAPMSGHRRSAPPHARRARRPQDRGNRQGDAPPDPDEGPTLLGDGLGRWIVGDPPPQVRRGRRECADAPGLRVEDLGWVSTRVGGTCPRCGSKATAVRVRRRFS